MQAPVAELAWTQYVGFGVLLGAIFLSAMATWSWARVCAGHLAALRKVAEDWHRGRDGQSAGEFAEAWHRQREDQAEREIYRLGEKLRAQSREDLLRAQSEAAQSEAAQSEAAREAELLIEREEQAAQPPYPLMTPELEARFARWCEEQDAAENRKIRDNHDAVRKVRWDEGEQALTSRPEILAEAQAALDRKTTAAGFTAVPNTTPALCKDRSCIWFGKFDHVWHLLPVVPGQEEDPDE